MFCDRCGTRLAPQARFCQACGKNLAPLMPQQNGMQGHVRLLGILWLALSAFRLLPAVFLFGLTQTRFLPPGGPTFVYAILSAVAMLLVILAIAGGAVGIGLLTHQSWARTAAIVFGGLSLIDMPLGTGIGVYTLWVLLPADHAQEYTAMSQAA